ncbi:MAG: Protein translocase subunit SecE [Verrucomicrobia subdivision 3 bacterium]|nr:Protein translocase subunit SecE [Limisphaerales bacterium]MCS1416014.1 Protein translocase subunit SecE [Limisphaerales bacterium]
MDYSYIIWIVVAGVVFGFLWRKGYLLRLSQYVGQTRDELRKCAWPTKDELKGSTVVVIIATVIIGLYTVSVDTVFMQLMHLVM